nr:MAG TPA: hypothetical protein [Caudoviricetes sp.]
MSSEMAGSMNTIFFLTVSSLHPLQLPLDLVTKPYNLSCILLSPL